jgi:protein YibB
MEQFQEIIMSNITIVTAFFDIGRGEWTPDKGYPHYLHRTNETYIERFSYMAKLENPMVIFTTPDMIAKLKPLREDRPTQFVEFNLGSYSEIREKIVKVQRDEKYQAMIHPSQRMNPEYWNPDYVLVNFLKSTFVTTAIQSNMVLTDLVAWLDFGYCRTADKIPPSKKWSYNFDTTKIHLFNYKEFQPGDTINRIIATNDVYILGAKIVGGKEAWTDFGFLINSAFNVLYDNGLMDDDQTLLLLATLFSPNLFELHRIPDHQLGLDPFIILKDYNNEYDI